MVVRTFKKDFSNITVSMEKFPEYYYIQEKIKKMR